MTKAEFIERYGVEAWERKLESQRKYRKNHPDKIKEATRKRYQENPDYNKKYYIANKEKIQAGNKAYYEANKKQILAKQKEHKEADKEHITVYKREWANRNKEQIKERYNKWYNEHKNERADYNKKYRTANNDKIREYGKSLRGRARNLANIYKSKDKNRGFDPSNNVTQKWIIENIFSGQSCIYCGENKWERLGCDRIDNSKPHTPDNVVCSCGLCNIERNDNCSVEEFKRYRALHPRACDIPKAPAFILSSTGALKKKTV